jgi:hypothetical protein
VVQSGRLLPTPHGSENQKKLEEDNNDQKPAAISSDKNFPWMLYVLLEEKSIGSNPSISQEGRLLQGTLSYLLKVI